MGSLKFRKTHYTTLGRTRQTTVRPNKAERRRKKQEEQAAIAMRGYLNLKLDDRLWLPFFPYH
jgi:hypothetical protein